VRYPTRVILPFPLLLLTGCPKPGPVETIANQPELTLAVTTALRTGATLSILGRDNTGSYEACLIYAGMQATLNASADAVAGLGAAAAGGDAVYPEVTLAAGPCESLAQAATDSVDVGPLDEIVDVVLASTGDILTIYGPDFQGQNCEGFAWATAGVEYARGVVAAVMDEVENPDLSITIPGVVIDLSNCTQGENDGS